MHIILDEDGPADGLSHVGGRPLLPPGTPVPVSRHSGEPMTHFLQVEMPPGHPWAGRLVQVFADVNKMDEEMLPPNPSIGRGRPELVADFFDTYEDFHRVLVVDGPALGASLEEASDKPEIVRVPLRFGTVGPDEPYFGWIGPDAQWYQGDESPASLGGSAEGIVFLFQCAGDYSFEGAGRADMETRSPNWPYFELFNQNECYFIGIERGEHRHVYVVAQN